LRCCGPGAGISQLAALQSPVRALAHPLLLSLSGATGVPLADVLGPEGVAAVRRPGREG